MDELEGTLRGHIGLIEESLERIEGNQKAISTEQGWGKGMGSKAEDLYSSRSEKSKKDWIVCHKDVALKISEIRGIDQDLQLPYSDGTPLVSSVEKLCVRHLGADASVSVRQNSA